MFYDIVLFIFLKSGFYVKIPVEKNIKKNNLVS